MDNNEILKEINLLKKANADYESEINEIKDKLKSLGVTFSEKRKEIELAIAISTDERLSGEFVGRSFNAYANTLDRWKAFLEEEHISKHKAAQMTSLALEQFMDRYSKEKDK